MKNAAIGIPLAAALFSTSFGSSYEPQKFENLDQRIQKNKAEKNSLPDKYAVIIAGDYQNGETQDLAFAYQVFLENGYERKNIYILDEDGEYSSLYPVLDFALKSNIEKVFSHLSKRVDCIDTLFVYISSHGIKKNVYHFDQGEYALEVTAMSLPGPDMTELDLKKYLDPIKSKKTIVFADMCYGGGFVNRFSESRYVGISSAPDNEISHGTELHSFGRHFMEAHRDTEKSDLNHDDKVSIKEAFEYAKRNHPWVSAGIDKPVLKSELDADAIYLNE